MMLACLACLACLAHELSLQLQGDVDHPDSLHRRHLGCFRPFAFVGLLGLFGFGLFGFTNGQPLC